MNCRVWYPSGDSGDLFFLNTQVLHWDVAQERKKAMKKEALYGNFCIGIESTTALP